jgi:circadian clock protein KaiC
MVLAQQGLIGTTQTTVDLTYLADTVVLSRYFESRGEVKQALSVIKKRESRADHSRDARRQTGDLDWRAVGGLSGSAHRCARLCG